MTDNTNRFHVNTAGYSVYARYQLLGKDLMLTVWGGQPHIGAVAMAQPRPSLKESNKMSATASVFCYVGHKDDEVAKIMAETISASLNTKVVVAAGLHWDDLTGMEIKQIMAIIEELTLQITNGLRKQFTKAN